jgi:spore coat protein CotF
MNDKTCLNDFLISQKQISSSYNTFAGECVNPQLRNDMLCILNEEHQIQSEIFNAMQSRGWYTVKQADQQQVMQAKQKISST